MTPYLIQLKGAGTILGEFVIVGFPRWSAGLCVLGGDPIHPMARGRSRIPNDRQPMIWRAR